MVKAKKLGAAEIFYPSHIIPKVVLKFLVDTIKGFTIWAPQNLDMKVKYPIRAVGELTSEPVLTGGKCLEPLCGGSTRIE